MYKGSAKGDSHINSLGYLFCVLVTAPWTIKLALLGKIKHGCLLPADYINDCGLFKDYLSNKELTVYKYEDLCVRGANNERHAMMR